MSEESSTTNPVEYIKGDTPKHNTLGMQPEEYEQYQTELINEYDNSILSISAIAEREQQKGIMLYPDRLKRWIVKAGVRVKPQKESTRKMEGGGRAQSFYLRNDQADVLDQFESKSDIARVAFDLLLGIPTHNIILFLSEKKSVIFIDDKEGVKTYITAELTDMETKVIQTLTNKVQQHGLYYVQHFAVENELKFYGGE